MAQKRRSFVLMGATVLLLLVTLACGPVVTVVVTPTPSPAVSPPVSEVTVSAPTAAPPTEALSPEPTTSAGCTLGARWVADVTVPDNTVIAPGTPFVKTWRVRNSGTCAWGPGTRLIFVSGTPMGDPAADVPALAPGAQADVSVNLTAPAAPGTYRANYQFQAPDGTRFGPVIWVQIVVPGTPTLSPAPVCTPPACPPGQVLYCPGVCPGGCGVVCVTPTPYPPSGLAILSFSAEVLQDVPGGKRVRFSWRTQGATTAIISPDQVCRRFMVPGWSASPPEEGSLIVDLIDLPARDPVMTLVARDAAGHEVRTSVVVPVPCRYPWFFPTDNRCCPHDAASTTWAAEEPFEHGWMLWLEKVQSREVVISRVILVFYENGSLEEYDDTFVEGEPESDPSIVPPPGLYQPIRGFGKLWRTHPEVRDRLGWATAPEQGFYTQWQQMPPITLGVPKYVRRINGKVIEYGAAQRRGSWRELP